MTTFTFPPCNKQHTLRGVPIAHSCALLDKGTMLWAALDPDDLDEKWQQHRTTLPFYVPVDTPLKTQLSWSLVKEFKKGENAFRIKRWQLTIYRGPSMLHWWSTTGTKAPKWMLDIRRRLRKHACTNLAQVVAVTGVPLIRPPRRVRPIMLMDIDP